MTCIKILWLVKEKINYVSKENILRFFCLFFKGALFFAEATRVN